MCTRGVIHGQIIRDLLCPQTLKLNNARKWYQNFPSSRKFTTVLPKGSPGRVLAEQFFCLSRLPYVLARFWLHFRHWPVPQTGHPVSTSQKMFPYFANLTSYRVSDVIFHFFDHISGVYQPILPIATLIDFSTPADPSQRVIRSSTSQNLFSLSRLSPRTFLT